MSNYSDFLKTIKDVLEEELGLDPDDADEVALKIADELETKDMVFFDDDLEDSWPDEESQEDSFEETSD